MYGPDSYINDNWNKVDFIITISIWLERIIPGSDLKKLRVLRTLRPLSTIQFKKSLKKMVSSIFSSFKTVKETLLIFASYVIIFAIIQQQIFKGLFKHRCVSKNTVKCLNQGICYNSYELGDYQLCHTGMKICDDEHEFCA